MTDKPTQQLTTQQQAAIGKTKPGGVSGRLKAALDDMVWNGTPWEEAATKANLTVRAMRLAMKRPQVLKYLRVERGVMIAQASAQNFHRIVELRDQDENRAAAVTAARTIETMANEALGVPNGGLNGGPRHGWLIDLREATMPGLQIVVVQPGAPARDTDAGMVLDGELAPERPNIGMDIRGSDADEA